MMLNPAPVPLPVKRCLASSFHTMCCILGRDIVSAPGDGAARPGILQVYEHYFLRDPDDTVRLNVMRTLPSLLSLLDAAGRSGFSRRSIPSSSETPCWERQGSAARPIRSS